MAAALLSVAGKQALSGRLAVPYVGIWVADLELDQEPEVAGEVEVVMGSLTLQGTVVEARSGGYQHAGSVRVVGGSGGWRTVINARHYHNDAGLKRGAIARDAAAAAGEVLVVDATADGALGVDYVRRRGPAFRVLHELFRGVAWWVDYAGVTRAGPRVATEIEVEHEVLDADPRQRTATIATERPDAIGPGSIVRRQLSFPILIRHLQHVVEGAGSRIHVQGITYQEAA